MPLYPNELLQRVATLIRAEERQPTIDVIVEAPDELPMVVGDADQLHQVCLNLAKNACQAMSETGGCLTLAAKPSPKTCFGGQGRHREVRSA